MPFIDGSKALVAGLAAAALLVGGVPAADAGVIRYQQEVKNFVKDTPKAAPSADAASKAAPAAKRTPAAASSSEGFDIKPLILPISIVALAGGAFALTTIDPGFAEMMVEGGSKDSRTFAGYETNLKNTPFFGVPDGVIPSSVPGNNTPKKGAAAKGKKKGGFF